jgi:hypothetical protein
MVTATVYRASNPNKKYTVVFDNGRSVSFGARGYQDYTMHKDPERMRRYKIRHPAGPGRREKHGKSGIYTAGFWAMNLLWNKPSLSASARDISRRFGVRVVLKTGSSAPARGMRFRKSRARK